MRIKYVFCLLIAMIASCLYAKDVQLDIDGALFKMDDNRSIWEFYYAFPDTLLNYKYKDGKYHGSLFFSVVIKSNVKEEAKQEWIVNYETEHLVTKFEMSLIGKKSFIIPTGQYNVEILIVDVNDTSTYAETKFEINARSYDNKRIAISDIQLSQVIEPIIGSTFKWNNSFIKKDFYVVPNATLLYHGEYQKLSFYYEVYHAKTVSIDGFNVNYTIYDAMKNVVSNFDKTLNSIDDAIVVIDSLPIDNLPVGVYYLRLLLTYPIDKPVDSIYSIKKFYVLNSKIPPNVFTNFMENASYDRSEYATLTPEQIKIEFDKAKIIASQYEIEEYEMLTENDAKKRFLYRFWLIRDPDTTTVINEQLLEYRKLIAYANLYFSYGLMKDGWQTDRGKILLKYGQPTEREQTPVKNEYRAYESWFYSHIQGGIYFYFVDLNNYGNFILVHSTANGEIRNFDWYDLYVPSHNVDEYQKNY